MSYRVKIQLTILVATAIICISAFSFFIIRYQNHSVTEAKRLVNSFVLESASKIQSDLNIDIGLTRSVAYAFAGMNEIEEEKRWESLHRIISDVYSQTDEYISFWTSFELKYYQDNYDKNYGRRTLTAIRLNGEESTQDKYKSMEGDTPGSVYANIKQSKEESVVDPYWYSITEDGLNNELITSIAIPILNKAKEFMGLAGVDISLTRYQEITQNIKPFPSSYAFLLGYDGQFIAHPETEFIHKKIQETYTELDVSQSILHKIQSGQSFSFIDDSNGEKIFYAFAPIQLGKSTTPWSLGVATPYQEIIKEIKATMILMMIIGFLALVVMFIVSWIITGRIVKFILTFSEFSKEINKGNLTYKMEIKRSDEVGELADSLKGMADSLRGIIGQLKDSSNNITQAGQVLNASSVELSNSSNRQASAVEEVASSMEEMASNIESNTDNSRKTEAIALDSKEHLEDGTQATIEASEAMKNIADKINIVTEIAVQTNLLALNAAVEAARAGEAGKGFAVVAAEVRKLAERSRLAADEISTLTADVQTASEKAKNKLLDTIPEMEKTTNYVQEITASSIEQNSGATQINNSIQDINTTTQQNASNAEKLALSAQELSEQAELLTNLINRFTI